jgi:hypothetical protein
MGGKATEVKGFEPEGIRGAEEGAHVVSGTDVIQNDHQWDAGRLGVQVGGESFAEGHDGMGWGSEESRCGLGQGFECEELVA